eukprot:1854926-Pyramimonas_sp.AAC.1
MEHRVEEIAFIRQTSAAWLKRTNELIPGDFSMPNKVEYNEPCQRGVRRTTIPEDVAEHRSTLLSVLELKVTNARNTRNAAWGLLPIVCFRDPMDGRNIFGMVMSFRKSPFIAEVARCIGPENDLTP